MAAITETIVSGPLCADAADCRLLGSALFGEDLDAGDAGGLRIGVVRDAVSEDVAPEVRDACEAAIEALRSETGGEVLEVELPELEPATLSAVLITNSEMLNGVTPAMLNDLDPGLGPINHGFVKYRALAAGGRGRPSPNASARWPGAAWRRSSGRSTRSPGRPSRPSPRRWRRRWSSFPPAPSPPTRPTCAAPGSPT